jgi:hypothetical protein
MCRLDYVWAHIDKGQLEVPDCVREHDDELERRPLMDYGIEPTDHGHLGVYALASLPHLLVYVSCSVTRSCRCEKYEVSISEYKSIQMSCGRGRDVYTIIRSSAMVKQLKERVVTKLFPTSGEVHSGTQHIVPSTRKKQQSFSRSLNLADTKASSAQQET